ncbi:MAG: hypothetical protein M0006_15695 [Magnetospirillum sp.]|nr:hypothetical protein [Magnetospirillum sp.]
MFHHTTSEPQQFLAWVGELPFLVDVQPKGDMATITFSPADTDFGPTWCDTPATFPFPIATLDTVGVDRVATDFATYQQQLFTAERACDNQAA